MADAYAVHRRIDAAALDALVRRARIGPSSRVLEVGCGTGNYSIGLRETTGARCCGIDLSRAMLTIAKARSAAVPFVRGTAEALPFADATCDVVFFVDVLHHVNDPARALAEAIRVARPGGAICVVTEDEPAVRARLHARYFPEVVPIELARYLPVERLRAILEAAGCAPVEEHRTVSPLSVSDVRPYRDRAFSSLHLIPEEAHRRGLELMRRDLQAGPIHAELHHVLVWARKAPQGDTRPT